MYFLYVLQSERFPRTYIGISGNVAHRLKEHNSGQVRSTKQYRPYTLIHTESFLTKADARKRELRLKNHSATKEELFTKLGLKSRALPTGPIV